MKQVSIVYYLHGEFNKERHEFKTYELKNMYIQYLINMNATNINVEDTKF